MKNRYTFLYYSIKVQKRQMRELSVQVTRNLTDKMRQNFRSQFTDGKIKCKNFTNGKPAVRFPFWRERGDRKAVNVVCCLWESILDS